MKARGFPSAHNLIFLSGPAMVTDERRQLYDSLEQPFMLRCKSNSSIMAMKTPGVSQLRPPLNYGTFVLCSRIFFSPSVNLYLLNTAVAMVTGPCKIYPKQCISVSKRQQNPILKYFSHKYQSQGCNNNDYWSGRH